MIYLLFDTIITSLSHFQTSFIIFDTYKKHSFIYILLISIIISLLTQNIFNILLIIFIYYLNIYLKKHISNKYILYFISYILLFNIHISLTNLIIFLFSVLILYFNPYN